MRKEFEMTEVELGKIIEASKPAAYMIIGGHSPSSQQESVNRVWQALANKKGFVWDTVIPDGRGDRSFTAEVK